MEDLPTGGGGGSGGGGSGGGGGGDEDRDMWAHRRAAYKKGSDEGDARRAREKHMISISKNKKAEQVTKRRQAMVESLAGVEGGSGVAAPMTGAAMAAARLRVPTADDIPVLVRQIASGEEAAQLAAVTAFRKMLSKEDNPPIDDVVRSGMVTVFVRFLAAEAAPRLQFESAWALTNIASGTSANTKMVVDAGAVPFFVRLLDSPEADVREQAVWALGNIAGDSPRCRNIVLEAAALPGVLRHLGPTSKLSFVRNATWTLSNFLRGKPAPAYEAIADSLPMLARLIHSDDVDVLTDGLWALSYLTDGDEATALQQALEAGVAARVAALLRHPSNSVQTPALRTVGNIVTGDEVQTQVVINVGALEMLAYVFTTGKRGLKKEACWAISNIMAGNREQVAAVCRTDIVPALVGQLLGGHKEIKKEACWAISNATSGGGADSILYLVQQRCLEGLACMLDNEDERIVMVAMEGIENILKGGEVLAIEGAIAPNYFLEVCEAADVPHMLDVATEVEAEDVYHKAIYMLNTYFPAFASAGAYTTGEAAAAPPEAGELDPTAIAYPPAAAAVAAAGSTWGGHAAAAPGNATGHFTWGGAPAAGAPPPAGAAPPSAPHPFDFSKGGFT